MARKPRRPILASPKSPAKPKWMLPNNPSIPQPISKLVPPTKITPPKYTPSPQHPKLGVTLNNPTKLWVPTPPYPTQAQLLKAANTSGHEKIVRQNSSGQSSR